MTNKEATTETTAATAAPQGANVAPTKGAAKKKPTPKKGAPKAKTAGKGANPTKKVKTTAKPAASRETKPTSPRAESMGAKILDLIRRPKGATLAEIMKATGWQAHSVRGFISTAGRKHDVTIASSRSDAGDRIYRIAK